MSKRVAGDGRRASAAEGFEALRAIGEEVTGARRIARVLDALAEISLQYDTRAVDESPKRRDHLAFVAETARMLHELVAEAASGRPDAVLVAVSRVERLTTWVGERETPRRGGTAGRASGRGDALRLCRVLAEQLLPAAWNAPPAPTDRR